MTTIKSIGILASALLLAVACGSSGGSAGASPSSSGSSDSAMHHAGLDVFVSKYGQVLVDGQGRALYLFAADTAASSTCYDACATAWPPMLTDKGAKVDAMQGVSATLTGTTTRKDGSLQVTYNGHPLYYFKGDTKPGEINCQAVVNFGAAWYVVDPQGSAVTKTT